MTIKQQIMRIMELALLIDPPEVEDVGRDRPAVFVRWSPHCNCFNVDIHLDGWSEGDDPSFIWRVYTDCETADRELAAIIFDLERIAKGVGVL